MRALWSHRPHSSKQVSLRYLSVAVTSVRSYTYESLWSWPLWCETVLRSASEILGTPNLCQSRSQLSHYQWHFSWFLSLTPVFADSIGIVSPSLTRPLCRTWSIQPSWHRSSWLHHLSRKLTLCDRIWVSTSAHVARSPRLERHHRVSPCIHALFLHRPWRLRYASSKRVKLRWSWSYNTTPW